MLFLLFLSSPHSPQLNKITTRLYMNTVLPTACVMSKRFPLHSPFYFITLSQIRLKQCASFVCAGLSHASRYREYIFGLHLQIFVLKHAPFKISQQRSVFSHVVSLPEIYGYCYPSTKFQYVWIGDFSIAKGCACFLRKANGHTYHKFKESSWLFEMSVGG